jgi:hypothetical protein
MDKRFDVRKMNEILNNYINWMNKWSRSLLIENETRWEMIRDLGKSAEKMINVIGMLPENARNRRTFIKKTR